ncbi:MAG: tetratricopeptide repeat protein [candidate division Zixibacteria bacterium]|nr:tetratricopeptide repeat protein [candidate division Zixibacteria bacterium]
MAFGLRLAVFFQSRDVLPVETPVLDSRYYLEAGRAIASGEGLGTRPYFMSPGYIWFSAFFNWAFDHPNRAIVLFQILLDSLTCVLTALLAGRLFGYLAGLVAGVLLAASGYQILSATRILPETAAAFLMPVLLFAFLRGQEKPGFKPLFFAGAVLGLLALLRSNSLLILPFLGLALWLSREEAGFKSVAVRFSYVLLGAAVVILPVTHRNLTVGRDMVLISSSGGVNFYLGNVTEGDGRFISLNQLPLAPGSFDDDPTGNRFEKSIQAYAEREEGRALRPSQVSAFWTGLALQEIAQAPLAWLKLFLRKIFLFFNAFEVPQVDNLYFLSRYLSILDGPLAHISRILWPLGLFGFLVLLFSTRRPVALLSVFIGYALSVIFFFVTARHRLPVVPLAASFAGFAVAYLYELLQLWNIRRILFGFTLFAICAVFTNLNPAFGERSNTAGEEQKKSLFGVGAEYLDFASQHNNTAALLLEGGDMPGAERESRQGLALKPQHSTLLFNLARALDGQGRLPEARAAAEQSLRNSPNNAVVAAFLGDLYYKSGDFAGARQVLEAALRLSPANAGAWNTLGPTLYRLGDLEGALAALGRAESLSPGWLEPRYNRGILLSRLGRHTEAAALLDSLGRSAPDNRDVALARAEALIGAKRFEEAKQLLDAGLEKAPENVGALLLKAELFLKQSRPKEARLSVLRALAVNPNNSRALELLQACDKMEKRGRLSP